MPSRDKGSRLQHGECYAAPFLSGGHMIKITTVLAALALALSPTVAEAGRHGGGSQRSSSSSRSYTSHRTTSHASSSRSHGSGSHSTTHHSTSGSHRSTYSSTATRDNDGRIKRSSHAKTEFKKSHPCPSTGKSSGACPGYVIDHVKPLKRGGADAPSNMQWQTTSAAKAKDKWE